MIKFESAPNHAVAVIDLTDAYIDYVERAHRTFEMIDRSYIVVTDSLTTKKPNELWWFMHTTADVDLKGNRAILTHHGKELRAEILSPPDAIFTVMDAITLSANKAFDQGNNRGRRKLAIHFDEVSDVTIKVKLTPHKE